MLSITVAIPVRNGAATLGRVLASVQRQRVPNPVEIVVADDGSTDGSAGIAHAAGATAVPSRGRGSAAARNTAIAASTGDVLALLDADDAWSDGYLAEVLACMEDGASWTVGRSVDVTSDGRPVRERVPGPLPLSVVDLLTDNRLVTSATALRRELLVDEPFDERLRFAEDLHLWARLVGQGYQPMPLSASVSYRERVGGEHLARLRRIERDRAMLVDDLIRRGLVPSALEPKVRRHQAAQVGLRYLLSGHTSDALRCGARGLPTALGWRVLALAALPGSVRSWIRGQVWRRRTGSLG